MKSVYIIICFLFVFSIIYPVSTHTRNKRNLFSDLFSSKSCIKNGEKITSPEDICCEGYNLTADVRCIAVCSPNCGNGKCVAPNTCECLPNFTLDLSGTCVVTCPHSCLNGRCLPDGTCECNPGYLPSRNRQFCQPFCSQSCSSFMNCTAPGVCSCQTGYQEDPPGSGACNPVCEKNCLGGECAAPNACFCYPGHKLKDGVCQAECKSGCRNGKCVLRDICICDPGYTFNETTGACDPVCSECSNGICIAPDICQCFPGFVRQGKTCSPYCERGCPNGYCIAPMTCVCRDGYGKDPNNICVPLNCRNKFTEKECNIQHVYGIAQS